MIATCGPAFWQRLAPAKGSGVAPVYRGAGSQSLMSPFFPTYGVVWPTVPANGIQPQVGDFALLVIHTEGGTTSATPSGWTAVPGSPARDINGPTGCTLNVFYKRVTSVPETTVTVTKVGVAEGGVIMLFAGVIGTGDPWDVLAIGGNATASTTVTWPSVSPIVANPLMVYLAARASDLSTPQYSGFTSTSGAVTGLTERVDGGATSGVGNGMVAATGSFAGLGPSGTVTATKANSTTDALMVLALYG